MTNKMYNFKTLSEALFYINILNENESTTAATAKNFAKNLKYLVLYCCLRADSLLEFCGIASVATNWINTAKKDNIFLTQLTDAGTTVEQKLLYF